MSAREKWKRKRQNACKLMEKFIPSYTHNTHTHTHKKSFIIMGRNSSTNSCSVFFIFLFTLCVSFWNDSTIKTNLNWSGWKFSFLLTAFHSLPHTTILPFKFLWILSKNLRHQAQFLSERNSQVDIRRERESEWGVSWGLLSNWRRLLVL